MDMRMKSYFLMYLGVFSLILLYACEAEKHSVGSEVAGYATLGVSKYYLVEFENDFLKIVRVTYEPGEKSGMQRYDHFIGLHLTDIDNLITMPDGSERSDKRDAHYVWESKAGETYAIKNMRDQSTESIFVQLKGDYEPSASFVVNGFDSEGTQMMRTLLLEGAGFRVYKSVFPEGATEPEHSHNAKVSVFVNGGHVRVRNSTGKEVEVKRVPGEAVYGDEVVHMAKNMGPTMEVVIFELM